MASCRQRRLRFLGVALNSPAGPARRHTARDDRSRGFHARSLATKCVCRGDGLGEARGTHTNGSRGSGLARSCERKLGRLLAPGCLFWAAIPGDFARAAWGLLAGRRATMEPQLNGRSTGPTVLVSTHHVPISMLGSLPWRMGAYRGGCYRLGVPDRRLRGLQPSFRATRGDLGGVLDEYFLLFLAAWRDRPAQCRADVAGSIVRPCLLGRRRAGSSGGVRPCLCCSWGLVSRKSAGGERVLGQTITSTRDQHGACRIFRHRGPMQ